MYRLLVALGLGLSTGAAAAPDLPPSLRGIIPTPQRIEAGEGEFVLAQGGEAVASLVIPAQPHPQVALAAAHLARRIEEASGVALPVVRDADFAGGPALWFDAAADGRVEHAWQAGLDPDQQAQEYLIAPVVEGSGYALVGREPLGTLYAAMTLLGALEMEAGEARFPRFSCHDWPDIAWRWLGGLPPLPSFEGQIEWCMEHKISLINAPGFYHYSTADTATQLGQNRFARAHGVRLVNLLYGDMGLRNRRAYPDGETYVCLDEGAPSERGFCVTNAALLAEKQRLLREFVAATEPGVLYIHFVDEDDLGDATAVWLNRCPDCRAAYPSDLVEAADGKAGAQAKVFDAMCDAIFSVADPESGYEAARDCLVIFVSAPYTVWSEDDAAWDREVAYHCTVSRLMRHVDNVHFCIRENGLRRDDGRKRCQELAEALRARGGGHRVMMYFRLGDSRDTTIGWPRSVQVPWPLLAAPAMTVAFEGAGSILTAGSGPALLKVEYAWNLRDDGFFYDPQSQDEWRQTYVGLSSGALRPDEVFGDEGFLGRMLAHLYGAPAARHLGVLYRPRSVEAAQGVLLPPVEWTTWLTLAREPWFATTEPERLRQFATLFTAWRKVNGEALEAVSEALDSVGTDQRRRAMLAMMEQGLQVAARLQEAAAQASEAWALLLEDHAPEAEAAMASVTALCAQARALAAGVGEREQGVAAEEAAMADHYRALVLSADQLRAARERLAQARESAGADREALLAELADPAAADPGRLAGKTIALVGGGVRSEIAALVEPHGAAVLPVPTSPDLPDEALGADLIVLASRTLSPAGQARLRQYLEQGGAVLLGGATPFYLVGQDVELAKIALWLGAERYGNYAGPAVPAGDMALTRGIEPDETLQATGSSACLYQPLGAAPILTAGSGGRGMLALAHRFGRGRVGYLWTLSVGDDSTRARPQVLLRMIAWLVGGA